jgi:hypothetical protein
VQQQDSITPQGGKIALRYGLIFGLMQTIIASIMLLIMAFTDPLGESLALLLGVGALVFIIGLVAYFVAGTLAAKQTGKVSTGTISGLWTGTFYGVLACIVNITLFLSISLPKRLVYYDTTGASTTLNTTSSTFKAGLEIGGIGFAIFGLFFAIGVGAGIGALGGLLGRSQARKNAPQPYPAQPYPAQPYPQSYSGQPYPQQPYPAPPSYPPQPYPGISNPYAQPAQPAQQPQSAPSEQPPTPAPTEWNPYDNPLH